MGGATSVLFRHLKNSHNIDSNTLAKSTQAKLENIVKLFHEFNKKGIVNLICKDLIIPNNIATDAVLRK